MWATAIGSVLAGMALCALSVSNADLATAQTFTIMGEGAVSCGTWLDQRKLGAETYGSWVLGYMTAASCRYRDPRAPDFLHGIRWDGIKHWLDNYCISHPLDEIHAAAAALVDELIARR